jgi:hypothetical protein
MQTPRMSEADGRDVLRGTRSPAPWGQTKQWEAWLQQQVAEGKEQVLEGTPFVCAVPEGGTAGGGNRCRPHHTTPW